MPIKYIGRTTLFRGKTLWEIVGNLKNYGEGRVVVRSSFERYPENSWLRIIKVEPLANPENPSLDDCRKVKATVEKVFRGKKYPNPVELCRVSYKADYRLLSRSEEETYCKLIEPENPLPRPETVPLPPLLKELLGRNQESKPVLKLNQRHRRDNRAPKAQGNTPESDDVPINQGLGNPIALRLYENVLQ